MIAGTPDPNESAYFLYTAAERSWIDVRLSVCMIVKNEQCVLDRCLSAASRFADELIVVDTGSTDHSKEIARKYTPHVYEEPWHDSFCDARNISYSKATGDYLMWLDADDVIDEENIGRFLHLKGEAFQNADVVYTIYRESSETGLTAYRLRDRIIRRDCQPVWKHDVHEVIPIDPSWKTALRKDITILHKKERVLDPDRNMRILNRMLRENKPLDIHDKINLCREYTIYKEYEDACQVFREIRHELHGPRLITALHFAENAFLELKLYEELESIIEDAEKEIPPIARDRYIRGICREMLGDLHSAAELFKEAIRIPDNPETMTIVEMGYNDYFPYLRLAVIAHKNGRTAEGIRWLSIAGEHYPREIGWRVIQERLRALTEPADTHR